MALDPLGNAVLIDVIQHEPDTELLTEFSDATENFGKGHDFDASKRQIEAAISQKEPQVQQGTVIAAGPECKELELGDVVIFPLFSGSMVTIMDPIEETYKRVFVLSEKACIARYREG